MKYKYFYAVQKDMDDNDWGYGSYNLNKAMRMALETSDESRIAVIDEESGDEPFCDDIIEHEDLEYVSEIKELRELTRLSQQAFADKYHVGKYALQGWEQGRRECPSSVCDLISEKMGFNTSTDAGVHDIEFWLHYDKEAALNTILDSQKLSYNNDWLINNNKISISDVYGFVEMLQDEFCDDVVDPAFFDAEEDDLKEFRNKYTCGYDSFLSLRQHLMKGDTIYRDNTYVGIFNPFYDLDLENGELDFDIPYILEITE